MFATFASKLPSVVIRRCGGGPGDQKHERLVVLSGRIEIELNALRWYLSAKVMIPVASVAQMKRFLGLSTRDHHPAPSRSPPASPCATPVRISNRTPFGAALDVAFAAAGSVARVELHDLAREGGEVAVLAERLSGLDRVQPGLPDVGPPMDATQRQLDALALPVLVPGERGRMPVLYQSFASRLERVGSSILPWSHRYGKCRSSMFTPQFSIICLRIAKS